MKVLVTGGAGFIGSHVVDVLLGAGHQVSVVDNLWERGGGRLENVDPQARFYQVDIRDVGLVGVFEAGHPDLAHSDLLSLTRGGGEAFCIASGQDTSVIALYQGLVEAIGHA